MKIGYVGLGAMGGALARWLVADHDLMVWDLNPDAMARFAEYGAMPATSLPDMARACDIVFLCLPRSSNVETAIFGDGGLVGGLAPGKIVIDQTSGVGAETRDMAIRLAAQGVDMLDAPVAGGVPSAVGGTITIMLSGDDGAQARAMPALRAMTSKIYRASGVAGDAQSVKTLNNMMNMVFRVATLELAALAVRLGVPMGKLTPALEAGVAGNFTCRTVLPAIIAERSVGDFALTLMLKDNNQALELGIAAGVPMPLSALGRAAVQMNINIIGDHAGLDHVMPFMEQATGVRFMDTFDRVTDSDVTALTITALAAANRAIAYEILSVAAKMGMDLTDFGRILNNGSAWNRECENILDELSSGRASATTLGDAIDSMRKLEELNLKHGVTTLMLGEVRAIYETAARELGMGASVSFLATLYERVGDVTLRAA